MAVTCPFLDLHIGRPAEPLALAAADRPPEDAEVGHVELTDLRVDQRWSSSGSVPRARISRQYPTTYVAPPRGSRALASEAAPECGRFRDFLERLPHLLKLGPHSAVESLHELREWPHVGSVVDGHDAAGRVGRRVQRGQPTRHRVPDHDGRSTAGATGQRVQPARRPRRAGRCAAAVALRGQIDRNAPDGATVEALDDRPPGAAVERQTVEEHDRVTGP